MKPWFRDLPLDFSRDDTGSVERSLIQACPANLAALQLATEVPKPGSRLLSPRGQGRHWGPKLVRSA